MKNFGILLGIALLAFVLRFTGINWDQGYHLHPDERFLTMVGVSLKTPHSFSDYLNPSVSTFNPHNVEFGFFVYGTFPLILNKILALLFRNDTYELFTLQGRMLSAFMDVMAVLVVYKITEFFEKKYFLNSSVKFLAAFLYSIAVLPIQLSHFFAVDTFLNTFILLSAYFSIRRNTFLSAIFFGLAFSSKITVVFALPLLLYFLLFDKGEKVRVKGSVLLIWVFIAYLTVRLAYPIFFSSGNLFNPSISTDLIQNINQLKMLDNPNAWFPPSVQWIGTTPVWFAFYNLAFFGLGLPTTVLFLGGLYFVFVHKKKYVGLVVVGLWVIVVFMYQSVQFTKNMRYFLILYPWMTIFSAIALANIFQKTSKFFSTAILIILMLWPAMFFSVYVKKHSRVEASEWLVRNVSAGSTILAEHWDDALPLPVQGQMEKSYALKELPVFAEDNPQKWSEMDKLLQDGDYYVLSSNRGWGSILSHKARYPRMAKFYEDLFAGKTNYSIVKTFTSYPSLRYLGIPLEVPDEVSEETFSVYDHPVVMIFKKKS